MGADVSRVRFDPLRDFAGVVLQQGRLLLDADFNEYVAILDRRLRAETCDLTSFGPDPDHAGVAWVPRQTPDGVPRHRLRRRRSRSAAAGCTSTGCSPRTTASTPPGFDPLLSERTGHGRHAVRQAAVLADARSAAGRRPAPRLPRRLGARGHATSRIPTSSRSRSASTRPRAGRPRGRCGCSRTSAPRTCASDDDDIPGWLDVIRPSAGRLTTDTIDGRARRRPVRAAADRRLPRAREPDLPRRDPRGRRARHGDVQVVARQRLGRDPGRRDGLDRPCCGSRRSARTTCCASRPATGSRSSTTTTSSDSKPGEIRKVTVDDAERTITFTGALPADLQPANAADAAARHLRVRRWDQAGVVSSGAGAQLVDLDAPGSTGLITVPAGARRRSCSSTASSSRSRSPPAAAARFRARRPLDLRRAHRRHLDRDARRGAAARRPPPLRAPRHRSPSPTRRPTAGGCGRRSASGGDELRLHGLRDARVALVGALTIQDAVDQVKATRRHRLPRGRRLRHREPA